jgi:hypothetical protein
MLLCMETLDTITYENETKKHDTCTGHMYFNVAFKLVCRVIYSSLHDLSQSTKCHMAPSLVVT